jgi:hypothetical protein
MLPAVGEIGPVALEAKLVRNVLAKMKFASRLGLLCPRSRIALLRRAANYHKKDVKTHFRSLFYASLFTFS